jgi:RHS repeat-associated protein
MPDIWERPKPAGGHAGMHEPGGPSSARGSGPTAAAAATSVPDPTTLGAGIPAGTGSAAPGGARSGSSTPGTGTSSAGPKGPQLPGITMPKGGGAVKGIDEKLTVNLATGTAGLSVPFPATPGRQGHGPKLSLEYDSGGGNGPFGIGWRLPAASITRKTSLGLPLYQDADDSDVFVLSGAEDLVPLLEGSGSGWAPVAGPDPTGAYTVRAYRPRAEAAFSRVEKWTLNATGETHWRAVSRDNVTTLFGQDETSRVYDPQDATRVFSWLADLSYDDRGNAISFQYKAEDSSNVPVAAHESGRTVTANRYLKRVYYGNTAPYLPAAGGGLPTSWLFQVVLDYGEHDLADPQPGEATTWPCRADPFSSFRSCFEVRTYRLCRRLLMFHCFPDGQGANAVAVFSVDLSYTTDQPGDASLPQVSLLSSVTHTGYVANSVGSYTTAQLPPLQLAYSAVQVNDVVQVASPDVLANLPTGGSGSGWRWCDLDGEGISGVLAEDDGAWYYKRNISAFSPAGSALSVAFQPLQVVATKPVGPGPGSPQLVDLHADGHLCAVDFTPPRAGYFARDNAGDWLPFQAFPTTAAIDWASPDVRMVDLNGDGLADVLLTEDDAFTWWPWLAEDGFGAAQRRATTRDEDAGPAVVIEEGDWSVYLADMSGDGLSDLVRVRNGEICYWPNLGFGRFGPKVIMGSAPWMDAPDVFDARRAHLADIDGSGTADLVYLGTSGTTIWFNQSGNSYTAGTTLQSCPAVDDVSSVSTLDLLGTGTTCIVWVSPLPGEAGRQLRYIDLMASAKPHLLVSSVNNMGGETVLTYATSTRFYVEDMLSGEPWLTRLAFPVHVVAQRQVLDHVQGTELTASYSYHHGYFDGVEREFRGFARVDQTDTDRVPAASGTGMFTSTPPVSGDEMTLPPVLTRTWVNTGAYIDEEEIAAAMAGEYWPGDGAAISLAGTQFLGEVTPEEMREACRALRGKTMRTEIYALDGSAQQANPYSVSQTRYSVNLLQPPTATSYGAVYASELESISYHYERNADDPRVEHSMVLEIDAYGTVTKSASAAYPRRAPAYPQQTALLVTYAEHDVLNVDDQTSWYRIGLPVESRLYELTGVAPTGPGGFYDVSALTAQAPGVPEIPPTSTPTGTTPEKRLISRSRTIYRADDLSGPLPTGQAQPLALVDRTYSLCITADMNAAIYSGVTTPAAALAAATGLGGYVDLDSDGSWWAPTARLFYSPVPTAPDSGFASEHFYLPQGQVDPFGSVSSIAWEHDIAVVSTTDAVGNITTAQVNYRVLQPWLVTDANQNRVGARFDPLGHVVASASMGKALPSGGDEGDHLDLSTDEASASDDPTSTFDYNLSAYSSWADGPGGGSGTPQPVWAHTRARVFHQDASTPWIETYVYVDGMGRVAMTKAQAEPGTAPVRAPDGTLAYDAKGNLEFGPTQTRWAGSGKVVYDNKGNPVKSYEPFFDSSPAYTTESDLVELGVTALIRYDPLSRVVRVDNPDGTYRSVEFDPWQVSTSDEVDNVLGSGWYMARQAGGVPSYVLAAASTPQVQDHDPLGRTVRTTLDNGPGEHYTTTVVLDILGRPTSTVDALGRTVLTQSYDMRGGEVYDLSVDSGARWVAAAADGRPMTAWDSRDIRVDWQYDALRRPVALLVTEQPEAMRTAERTSYGEGLANAQARNLCGSEYQRFDEAGVATIAQRDFDGNITTASRQYLAAATTTVDWGKAPTLSTEMFSTTSAFDAFGRLTSVTTPDASKTTPAWNERSLLSTVAVNLRGSAQATTFVASTVYNAKGQCLSINYGNGAQSTCTYDPETFRLVALLTMRPSGSGPLQDLAYTYDPVGNVTHVGDQAQQTVFFANQMVRPDNNYTYDAIYRLVQATGRELLANAAQPQSTWDDSGQVSTPLPSDTKAMQNYTDAYAYDAVGNFLSYRHTAAAGSWARNYNYDGGASPPASNRLASTSVGRAQENYTYDANSNMTSMPQLTSMAWDFKDMLQSSTTQAVNSGPGVTTYYAYDQSRSRAQKLTNGPTGALANQRLYMGAFEVYREYSPGGAVTLERQALHVTDGRRRVCLVETTTIDTSAPPVTPVPAPRYQLGNLLDSAVLELDSSARLLTYEEYYPYGSTSFQGGQSVAETSLKRYRYTGKERDIETGLYYHGARYYAPWLGRWTSPDRAGLVDGPDLYAYCRDNPIVLHDPSGSQGTSTPQDNDGPPFYPLEVPPDPIDEGPLTVGYAKPSLSLGDDPPSSPPLQLQAAAAGGDASLPFVLPFYNPPGILGPHTWVLFTQPDFSVSGAGHSHLQYPSAVPGSPAASYLTMTLPADVGQSQVTLGPDPRGALGASTYQHQFGPSDPTRSGQGAIVSGSVTWTGIPGLTTDPIFSLGGLYLHEWTKGGTKEQPGASVGFNLGGGGGRGLQLTTGGMGGYGYLTLSGGASLFPFGYYGDTPAADASYRGTLVQPSQVPRITISAAAYANGFLGGPIDSTTHRAMLAGAMGVGAGVTYVTPRFGVNARLFVSGYLGYGWWGDNAASGGSAQGLFGSIGGGILFGAPPAPPNDRP